MPKPREVAGIRYVVMLAGTQKKLADVLKISPSTVNKWVRNGYVPDEWVERIHEIYPTISRARLCNPAYLEWFSDEDDL